MNNRSRIIKTLAFEKPDDRLPMIEWANWWNKTVDRWRSDGLPSEIAKEDLRSYWGLDDIRQFWLRPMPEDFPFVAERGRGVITDLESYDRVKNHLYSASAIENIRETLERLKAPHERGDIAVWITLEGFFWFPRRLFGIENHMYAFYDEPELMHRINAELTEFYIFLIEEFCKILKPDYMTFAEDMSYNHGPMLSYGLFQKFLLPYYHRVMPALKKNGITTVIDTDGQVEKMIPWLMEAGIEGVLPLERQAGVDIVALREKYPRLIMIGGYDKMVMNRGEEAMRSEFERILPVMKSGGYIPSCDHQTPPGVSLEQYGMYRRLLEEYCIRAVSR